jgi:hypothetical protein
MCFNNFYTDQYKTDIIKKKFTKKRISSISFVKKAETFIISS